MNDSTDKAVPAWLLEIDADPAVWIGRKPTALHPMPSWVRFGGATQPYLTFEDRSVGYVVKCETAALHQSAYAPNETAAASIARAMLVALEAFSECRIAEWAAK